MKHPQTVPQTAWGIGNGLSSPQYPMQTQSNFRHSQTPKANTVNGNSGLFSRSFMSPKFCERQTLLFYVESEPRGTSPVPNVEAGFYTMKIQDRYRPGIKPWAYQQRGGLTTQTIRPPRLSSWKNQPRGNTNIQLIQNNWKQIWSQWFGIPGFCCWSRCPWLQAEPQPLEADHCEWHSEDTRHHWCPLCSRQL